MNLTCNTVRTFDELLKDRRTFATIYCDPPWHYNNTASRAAAVTHYSTMSFQELIDLPIQAIARENAHLHLWSPSSFLQEALHLMDAWGFNYRSSFVWCKQQMGMGNYWRLSHEFLLLGVRGRLRFPTSVRSWLVCPRTEHSTKPDIVRKLVEDVSPPPRLELFGRRTSPGWAVLGNEIQPWLF